MLKRFFKGAAYFGRGLSWVMKHRALWPWVLMPTLLTGTLTVLGAMWAWQWAKGFVALHTAGHSAIITAILTFLMYVFVAGMGYVAFLVTSLIATAPFAGTLSERTEKLSRGAAITQQGIARVVREAVRATLHTCISLSLYLVLAAVLFFVQFVAAPIAPLVWLLSVLLTAIFLAYDAFSLPLERRDASFGRKWGFVGKHTPESLGFGVVVALVLAIPGFGLIVPAVAAVGGTLLFLDLE